MYFFIYQFHKKVLYEIEWGKKYTKYTECLQTA